MQMVVTDLRAGYTGSLQSIYLNTTDSCLEFYYWLIADTDTPILSAIAVSEERLQTVLLSIYQPTQPGWNRFYVNLPSGLNRIIIEGQRNQIGQSGLFVDDVMVALCSNFGK